MAGGRRMCLGAFMPPLENTLYGSFYQESGLFCGAMHPADEGGGTSTPDLVLRGCFPTYSLPTDHAGTAEYLTFGWNIPTNWDMKSNFRLTIWFAQADAETSGEKYVLAADHSFCSYGDVGAGTYAEAAGTVTLGSDGTVQYYEHHCEIGIPYRNAHGTAEPGGYIAFKLHRRILGTTGEALVMGATLGWWGTAFVGGVGGTVTGTTPAKKLAANRGAH